MADGVMISQLGRATEILGTDKIEIERDGASYHATIDELITYRSGAGWKSTSTIRVARRKIARR